VHLKDCEPSLAERARTEAWDYHTAVRNGIFCELGRGAVPFRRVCDALEALALPWLGRRRTGRPAGPRDTGAQRRS
jgi:hypothetical protein